MHNEDSAYGWPAFQPSNPSEGLDMEVSEEKLGNLCTRAEETRAEESRAEGTRAEESRAEETRAEENAPQLRQQLGSHLVPRASSVE